jgi:predicted metallopeptidase
MARFRFAPAPDVARDMGRLVEVLDLNHIDRERVHCRRSWGSTADIYARIWELPSIWQEALNVRPQYLIEVLAEHYDALDRAGRLKILIHELLHIPRTFSGAVRGHRGQGERIDDRTVERYFKRYRALGGHADGTDRDGGQMAIRFEKP